MEIHLDFMRCLETDAVVKILVCLDDVSDLISASLVSHFWRDFVVANGICKQLCLRNFPQLANIAYVTEPCHGVKKSTDVGSSTSLQWEALEREHRVYASLFRALTKVKVKDINCVAEAFHASSTDNFPQESINSTSDPRDEILQRFSYSSSKGQKNPDVPETLIFKLNADICVITEINIWPFQESGHPKYLANSVRFRMGHPKSPTEIKNFDLPLQQHVDEKIIWTYTSPEFSMFQEENVIQIFKLPEPVICMGGFVQLEMLGGVQAQQMDEKFYICAPNVHVIGRPLFPAFNVDIIESSGKFSLKYYPEALPRTMLSVTDPMASNVTLRTEDRMCQYVHWKGLGEFLRQRNLDGEVVEWDSDEDDE